MQNTTKMHKNSTLSCFPPLLLQRKKAGLLSPAQYSERAALEMASGEGRALQSADGALIRSRNEKYFPESVWHYGSLVWNQEEDKVFGWCLLAMSALAWKCQL